MENYTTRRVALCGECEEEIWLEEDPYKLCAKCSTYYCLDCIEKLRLKAFDANTSPVIYNGFAFFNRKDYLCPNCLFYIPK